MQPIRHKLYSVGRTESPCTVIQIEATNLCNRSCSNCVRFCGHFRKDKIFFIDIDKIPAYLYALRDFDGFVGVIGGEPTLHPQFEELCKTFQKCRPRHQCGIFTNTLTKQFQQYKTLIENTFGLLNYNNHSTKISHTPILVASEEIIDNKAERDGYIDKCWIQSGWSASITPKGAYFCEEAAMLAWLFDGPDGWDPTDENWWRKEVPEYKEQIEWACKQCGAAIPLEPRDSAETIDDVSPKNLEKLLEVGSPKALAGKCEIYYKGLHQGQNRARDWYLNGLRPAI